VLDVETWRLSVIAVNGGTPDLSAPDGPHDGDDYRRHPGIFKRAHHLMWAGPRFCRVQD